MVSPSPTPSPRTGPLTAAPPALLIPVDTDELDKEHDSFPDISTRQSFSSNTLAAKHHRRKTTLHLAPSSAAVTYQLSPLPLQSAAVQSERQTFLAHAALRSTFIKQGSMQRLSTLRGGVGSALLSTFYRPPLPITVRQETRSRLGSHTRQSTVSFAPAVATTLLEKINSNEQCGSREATKHRLPSYVPIVQVADSFVYRGEAEENERCQHGYEVMPVLSMLLEHQGRGFFSQHSLLSQASMRCRSGVGLVADLLYVDVWRLLCCCQCRTWVLRMAAPVCMSL